MSFVQALRSAFSQYSSWQGRARPSEYWWFTLAGFLGELAVLVVGGVLFAALSAVTGSDTPGAVVLALLLVGYLVAFLPPGIAVLVRRLHDTDRSGGWYWLSLVPFGSIAVLVFTLLEGTPGPNRYGPPRVPAVGAGYDPGQYRAERVSTPEG